MSCPSLETAAAWSLGELGEGDAEEFEAHFFGCDRCFESAQRMTQVREQLREALPMVLTAERRRALEAKGPIVTVPVKPGGRALLRLGTNDVNGLWLMQAPLTGAERVDFEARTPEGELMFALSDVPFDAERGEVVLACQLHYRAMEGSQEIHARLSATDANGKRPVADYILEHQFESV